MGLAILRSEDRPRESKPYKGRTLPTGVREVTLQDGTKRYPAEVWTKSWVRSGRKEHLGTFDTPEEAEYRRRIAIYGHHWQGMPDDRQDSFGFIYELEHKTTGRKYIGKKQFLFWDGPVGGYKVTDPTDEWFQEEVWRESDWATYTTSSAVVHEEDPWMFHYKVISTCRNKLELHLAEIALQIELDVLNAEDADGNPAYYNGNIAGMEFRRPFKVTGLRELIAESEVRMRDYYLKPKTCADCGSVIPYGESRCVNKPLLGDGDCER